MKALSPMSVVFVAVATAAFGLRSTSAADDAASNQKKLSKEVTTHEDWKRVLEL